MPLETGSLFGQANYTSPVMREKDPTLLEKSI
jgi:hypothetical protein